MSLDFADALGVDLVGESLAGALGLPALVPADVCDVAVGISDAKRVYRLKSYSFFALRFFLAAFFAFFAFFAILPS